MCFYYFMSLLFGIYFLVGLLFSDFSLISLGLCVLFIHLGNRAGRLEQQHFSMLQNRKANYDSKHDVLTSRDVED